MELNEYQEKAMTTCMPSCDNFGYMYTNLVGELGELSSKISKLIRKDKAFIWNNILVLNQDDEDKKAIALEAGDILWQYVGMLHTLGLSFEDVAIMNLEKLAARKKAGTIDGYGDGISGKDREV